MKLIYKKKQKYAETASPSNWYENGEKKQIKYERERNVDNLEKSVQLLIAHFSVAQEQLYRLLRVA